MQCWERKAPLFSLVGAASDEELPPIYGIFVNTKKAHRRRVLQNELERVARLMRCPAPVATQLLTQNFVRLRIKDTK